MPGIGATAPNSASRRRSTSMPVTASAPSAIATAGPASICRGARNPQRRSPGTRHHTTPLPSALTWTLPARRYAT